MTKPQKIVVLVAFHQKNCTLKDVAGGFGTVFTVGNSPFARLLEVAKRRIASLPNITLPYLHALFQRNGVEVAVLEINGEKELEKLVPADLYLIASSIVDCNFERSIANRVRRLFGSRVGIFGTFASSVPEFFEECADFIVKGEIENIAPRIAAGESFSGLVDAGFVRDLDALPFPNWDQFDLGCYRYEIISTKGVTLPLLSSRGCTFTCGYCPYLVNNKYRARTPESVLAEIHYLVERYNVRGISFRDPLFVFNRARSIHMADLLIQSGLNIRFSIESRTDCMDVPLLEKLHAAGLRSMEVGVESYDEEVLRNNSRKPPQKEQQEEIIRRCHRLGIRVIANYTFGLLTDTPEGIGRTIAYAKKLNTFAIQFTVTTPYPGTDFYEKVKDQIFEKDWEKFNGWTNVFRHPSMSPNQLHALREYAYVSYHLRPRYVWRFLESTLLHPLLYRDGLGPSPQAAPG